MAALNQDALTQLSDALAARAAVAAGLVASIHVPRSRPRSGILWRPDVVVGSEQVFLKADTAEIVLSDGRRIAARLAGRDRGTNVVALRLETPVEVHRPAALATQLGGLVLALGAESNGGPTVRLGVVRSLGPAWHSLAGGHIDCRIALDFVIGRSEEGGPVLDAAGHLIGMSTGGPGGRALVIPAETIERVIDPLLAEGRIERGWLGLALHPVALPEVAQTQTGQQRGLMVMRVASDGPCAKAGIQAGDILVAVDGTPASRPREISRQFGPDSVGKPVELRVIRSGTVQTVAATITARPAE
ncbi:MAG: serine protease [Alphaproteobacteria bacterium]|nr:serine protease [Alphaproteobacteria bacterium]MBV9152193.1 serine protease [Alphaproteobacteria bacterium]MBV9967605.1 serine protease [Alphaproteobacteria bacterium]